MKKIIGGLALVLGVGICTTWAQNNESDTFIVNIEVEPYCQFSAENGLDDISFNIFYNPTNGEWEYSSSPTKDTFEFECVKGSTFTITAESENGGKLYHGDENHYLEYQLEVSIYDDNNNIIDSTSNIFTESVSGTADSEVLFMGINDVNITAFGPDGEIMAGVYSDTVTMKITF